MTDTTDLSLEERLARLEHETERLHSINAIQNLVSKETYFYEATDHEKRFELIASQTPGVTVEVGGRGVFEGRESAYRTLVESEIDLERKHGEGMRLTYPDQEFASERAGMLQTQLVGTPVIEVAQDGKTARGMWVALMATAKTYDRPEQPKARWVWWKIAADFVKESDGWKILHLLKNPLIFTDYDTDWVQTALDTVPLTAEEVQAFHGADADRPYTKQYRKYSIHLDPQLIPAPPEPYESLDESDDYSY